MITIRDYAKSKGVSYEAIRRQVARYSHELDGHITKQNRTQFLDDAAVEILDQHRQESVIIVQHEETSEEVAKLREQLTNAQDQIINTQKQVIALQNDRASLIEYKAKYETMIEHKDETDKALQEAQEKAAAAEREVNSFKKTVLGLYRKEK